MTNITGTGNFGVNPHYPNEGGKQGKQAQANGAEISAPKKEINLNESSEAVSGKAMVNIQKGDYKFDPKNVESDVQEYKFMMDTLGGVAREYEQALIAEGMEPTSAQEKAAQFLSCLMSVENV